jgi:hypothetical protein
LLGLSLERANLALKGAEYLESSKALDICLELTQRLESEAMEHRFYQTGQAAFQSLQFIEDPRAIEAAKKLFGETWKQIRYHNLVRLGGDILKSGLGKYHKATVLGALLSFEE